MYHTSQIKRNANASNFKEQADKTYAEYESKQEHKSDPNQFHKSEVYVVDDKDYFKTYKDMYPDTYQIPPGLVPEKEDYCHSYGQKCQFMLIKDFDEAYTWFGKDFTQEQIDQAYEDRDNKISRKSLIPIRLDKITKISYNRL